MWAEVGKFSTKLKSALTDDNKIDISEAKSLIEIHKEIENILHITVAELNKLAIWLNVKKNADLRNVLNALYKKSKEKTKVNYWVPSIDLKNPFNYLDTLFKNKFESINWEKSLLDFVQWLKEKEHLDEFGHWLWFDINEVDREIKMKHFNSYFKGKNILDNNPTDEMKLMVAVYSILYLNISLLELNNYNIDLIYEERKERANREVSSHLSTEKSLVKEDYSSSDIDSFLSPYPWTRKIFQKENWKILEDKKLSELSVWDVVALKMSWVDVGRLFLQPHDKKQGNFDITKETTWNFIVNLQKSAPLHRDLKLATLLTQTKGKSVTRILVDGHQAVLKYPWEMVNDTKSIKVEKFWYYFVDDYTDDGDAYVEIYDGREIGILTYSENTEALLRNIEEDSINSRIEETDNRVDTKIKNWAKGLEWSNVKELKKEWYDLSKLFLWTAYSKLEMGKEYTVQGLVNDLGRKLWLGLFLTPSLWKSNKNPLGIISEVKINWQKGNLILNMNQYNNLWGKIIKWWKWPWFYGKWKDGNLTYRSIKNWDRIKIMSFSEEKIYSQKYIQEYFWLQKSNNYSKSELKEAYTQKLAFSPLSLTEFDKQLLLRQVAEKLDQFYKKWESLNDYIIKKDWKWQLSTKAQKKGFSYEKQTGDLYIPQEIVTQISQSTMYNRNFEKKDYSDNGGFTIMSDKEANKSYRKLHPNIKKHNWLCWYACRKAANKNFKIPFWASWRDWAGAMYNSYPKNMKYNPNAKGIVPMKSDSTLNNIDKYPNADVMILFFTGISSEWVRQTKKYWAGHSVLAYKWWGHVFVLDPYTVAKGYKATKPQPVEEYIKARKAKWSSMVGVVYFNSPVISNKQANTPVESVPSVMDQNVEKMDDKMDSIILGLPWYSNSSSRKRDIFKNYRTKWGKDSLNILVEESIAWGRSPYLTIAQSIQESMFDGNAKSGAKAKWLMQLIDKTAKALWVTNVYDKRQNVKAGVKYNNQNFKEFKDIILMLAAYNAWPWRVKKYGGVPPFKETIWYILIILQNTKYLQEKSKMSWWKEIENIDELIDRIEKFKVKVLWDSEKFNIKNIKRKKISKSKFEEASLDNHEELNVLKESLGTFSYADGLDSDYKRRLEKKREDFIRWAKKGFERMAKRDIMDDDIKLKSDSAFTVYVLNKERTLSVWFHHKPDWKVVVFPVWYGAWVGRMSWSNKTPLGTFAANTFNSARKEYWDANFDWQNHSARGGVIDVIGLDQWVNEWSWRNGGRYDFPQGLHKFREENLNKWKEDATTKAIYKEWKKWEEKVRKDAQTKGTWSMSASMIRMIGEDYTANNNQWLVSLEEIVYMDWRTVYTGSDTEKIKWYSSKKEGTSTSSSNKTEKIKKLKYPEYKWKLFKFEPDYIGLKLNRIKQIYRDMPENIKNIDLISDNSMTKFVVRGLGIKKTQKFILKALNENGYLELQKQVVHKMREEPKKHLLELAKDFFNENWERLSIASGYRDMTNPKLAWRYNIAKNTIARPNESEHALANTFDWLLTDSEKFKKGTAFWQNNKDKIEWMHTNAHKYGFTLSYTKGEKIDGYWKEAWHFRYVWEPLAKYLYEKNISFTQYYKIRRKFENADS